MLISVERKSSSDNRTSPRPSLRMSDIPSDVTVKVIETTFYIALAVSVKSVCINRPIYRD